MSALHQKIQRLFSLQTNEYRLFAYSFAYVFFLLAAYYVLRPIRDEFGAAGGVENLPWLFAATLAAMLLVNPAFAALVKRWPRRRFIAFCYRFAAANLLLFAAWLWWGGAGEWLGRVFFVWLSVFNLFTVSVFWSLMTDIFSAEQGKRLFGALAAGATLGGLFGALLTHFLVADWGAAGLFVLAAAGMEAAVQTAKRALASAQTQTPAQMQEERIGGSVWAGMSHTLRSPYLLGIAAFILLYSLTSTFLYFQQAELARAYFSGRTERTAFFAQIDIWVNALTLFCQLFLTAQLSKKWGVAVVLCILPALSAVGFAALAAAPVLGVLVAVQVARRVGNFAFARPMREWLFTRLPHEDRYKAKNFIDTAVYRAGDQAGSWGYAGLTAAGLGTGGVAVLAVPLCLVWLACGWWLGRYSVQTKPA